ncbi:MAG: hypothetical protein ACXWRA_15520, partial [Pseudobdellovibrionaceae bacterium]
KNEAVISYIKTSKYNFPNAAEAITCADQKYFGSGCESAKQMLKLSFRVETQNKESILNYTDCNLIVTSPTEMSLSSCKISGTLDVILSSK